MLTKDACLHCRGCGTLHPCVQRLSAKKVVREQSHESRHCHGKFLEEGKSVLERWNLPLMFSQWLQTA
jgi:hypothetical protein